MNTSVVILAAMQATTPANPLAFTMDVAQLVVLGGLVWRLAEMSSAVKSLTAVTKELGATVAQTVLDVHELKVREQERRDRRRDDHTER